MILCLNRGDYIRIIITHPPLRTGNVNTIVAAKPTHALHAIFGHLGGGREGQLVLARAEDLPLEYSPAGYYPEYAW